MLIHLHLKNIYYFGSFDKLGRCSFCSKSRCENIGLSPRMSLYVSDNDISINPCKFLTVI
jgi:hypothetical protein